MVIQEGFMNFCVLVLEGKMSVEEVTNTNKGGRVVGVSAEQLAMTNMESSILSARGTSHISKAKLFSCKYATKRYLESSNQKNA